MIFNNKATLSYNNTVLSSNTVSGVVVPSVSVIKSASVESYRPDEPIYYSVFISNTSNTAYTNAVLFDDFASYQWGIFNRFPIALVYDSVQLTVIGPQGITSATVSTRVSTDGISFIFDIPANATVLLNYTAQPTPFASLSAGSAITNSVSLTANGLASPVKVSNTLSVSRYAEPQISKSANSEFVIGGQASITITLSNYGNIPAGAGDYLSVSDVISPYMSNISAAYNGNIWTRGVHYTYEQTTGLFQTLPGAFTLPAADFTQNSYGVWNTSPSSGNIVITGTVLSNLPQQAYTQIVPAYSDGNEANLSAVRLQNDLYELSSSDGVIPRFSILVTPRSELTLLAGSNPRFSLNGGVLSVDNSGIVGTVTAYVNVNYLGGAFPIRLNFTAASQPC